MPATPNAEHFLAVESWFSTQIRKKGKTHLLCRLRSHCIYSSFSTVILQGRCSFHHHLYASPLQECPQSPGCCQLSGPWPLSQFLSPWRMLQEVRMAICMKNLVWFSSAVEVVSQYQQYILFISINNTCSIVLLIVPTRGVWFLVHVGVGRFKNKSYTDFLKAWNTARGLKTKIGPLEVCTALASYQCLPKRLGTRLPHLQLNYCGGNIVW